MADDYTIKMDSTGNGQVICNGKVLTNVVSFECAGGVNRFTELTLHMIDVNADISFEGLDTDDPEEETIN